MPPDVRARVVQPDQCASSIDRPQVGPFQGVAQHAGVCEIVNGVLSAVLPADNVINLIPKGRIFFVHKTVFTPVPCTLRYGRSQFGANPQLRFARISRALALAIRRMCSSSM